MRRSKNKGYTLSEIMIVIIVVAALSDIAMPIVSNIADQGRATATLDQMKSIKYALLQYKTDFGRFPHTYTKTRYDAIRIDEMGRTEMKASSPCAYFNPLVVSGEEGLKHATSKWYFLGFGSETYLKKWKGPYMDCPAEEFMKDAWDNDIVYCYYNKALWLHSYGSDFESASPTCFLGKNDTDDIVVYVSALPF